MRSYYQEETPVIRTSRHTQIVNGNIKAYEARGLYTYLRLHIEGTMDSFGEPVRIDKVKWSAGKNYAHALGSGQWIEYEIGRDRIEQR